MTLLSYAARSPGRQGLACCDTQLQVGVHAKMPLKMYTIIVSLSMLNVHAAPPQLIEMSSESGELGSGGVCGMIFILLHVVPEPSVFSSFTLILTLVPSSMTSYVHTHVVCTPPLQKALKMGGIPDELLELDEDEEEDDELDDANPAAPPSPPSPATPPLPVVPPPAPPECDDEDDAVVPASGGMLTTTVSPRSISRSDPQPATGATNMKIAAKNATTAAKHPLLHESVFIVPSCFPLPGSRARGFVDVICCSLGEQTPN